jgi:hypothetical protein
MRAIQENFIVILRMELKDLSQDLEQLIIECEKGHKDGHYSANIFLQNMATFRNELLGLNSFEHILDELQPESYDSLELMIQDIRSKFHHLVDSHGLVHAVKIYIDRKLDKVATYFQRTNG